MKHSANKIQIAGYDDLFGSSAPILLENVVEQVIEMPNAKREKELCGFSPPCRVLRYAANTRRALR